MQEKKNDELLDCLVIFTKLHNNPYTADALVAGLPTNENEDIELFSLSGSKSLFTRAAARAGFISNLVNKRMEDISPLVLPCILLLRGKKACILESFEGKTHAKIITPDMPNGSNLIEIEKLKEEYLGYSYLLKREFIPEDNKPNLIDTKTSHWFWGTLKRSRKIYVDVIVASVVINLFVLASPLFTMNVYDRVVPNNAVETLWVLALGVGVVYVIDLFLKFIRTYFLDVAGKKSDIIMSSLLFERVMDIKLCVKPKSVGSFANNLREFDTVRNFFTSSTLAVLIDLPFAILFLLITYFIAGYLVVVPLFFMAAVLCYTLFIKNPLQTSIKSTFEASAKKNGILIETLNGLETIKTMGATGNVQWNWEEATGEIANKSIKSKMISASINTVTSFLVQLNTVGIIVFGVYMIQDTKLTMGGLIAAVMLSSRAIAPMGQFASLLASYEQTRAAYESLKKIMQMPVERPEGKKFVRRNTFNGKIEFKNVSFTYPEALKPR